MLARLRAKLGVAAAVAQAPVAIKRLRRVILSMGMLL